MHSLDLKEITDGFKNATVILPAISVSNAGQLAVDLLIQSSNSEKVANIWHEAFIPLIGSHPYKETSTDISTEFEVYQLRQRNVLFLQFRSPLWESMEESFLLVLVKWFEQLNVSKVIILSSLYDYERTDCQIRDSHVRCCFCPITAPLYESNLRSLKCKPMEKKDGTESGFMSQVMFLPGAGFTQNLHLKCIAKRLPCISFFKFCSDGDNTSEALDLAKTVDGLLDLVPGNINVPKPFTQPPSWKYIFGGPSPQELFP